MTFVDMIRSLPDYIGSNGRTEEDIKEAEKVLGVSFASDYREYLREIGLACFDGHELTGLTKTAHVDVVSVTKMQRENIGDIVIGWYVVEEAGIDGIVFWQNEKGEIYQTIPNGKTQKAYNSLVEYIEDTQ